MSSKIHNCNYGLKSTELTPISRLDSLQAQGENDISKLVQEIVTKDFGYQGTEKFSLSLQNNKLVLELLGQKPGTQYASLDLNDQGQWARSISSDNNNNNNVVLLHSDQTSLRVRHTLQKISNVYQQSLPRPVSLMTAEGSGSVKAQNTTANVTHSIHCDHSALYENMRTLISKMKNNLEILDDKFVKLEKQISSQHPLSMQEVSRHIQPLQEKIDDLEKKYIEADKIQQKLKNENSQLKGSEERVDKERESIPEELKEIQFNIQQINRTLQELLRMRSEGAERLSIQEMRQELQQIKQALPGLTLQIEKLTKDSEKIQKENENLKIKNLEEQLNLQNKTIVDLTQKNTLLKAQLDCVQRENQQLTKDYKDICIQHHALKTEKDEVQLQLTIIKDDYSNKVANNQSLEEELKSKINKNSELTKQLKRTTKTVITQKEHITTLSNMCKSLETEQKTLQKQLQNIKMQLEESVWTNKVAQQTINNLSLQNESLQKISQLDQQAVQLAKQQVQEVTSQLEQSEYNRSEISLENSQLKDHLQTARKTTQASQEQLQRLQKKYEEADNILNLFLETQDLEKQLSLLPVETPPENEQQKEQPITPTIVNTTPPPSNAIEETNDVALNNLNQIAGHLTNMKSEVDEKWVNAILINLHYLGVNKKPDEIFQNFDPMTPQNIKSLQAHTQNPLPKPSQEPLKTNRANWGALTQALDHNTFKLLEKEDQFANLNKCFEGKLFIAKTLKELQNTLEPAYNNCQYLNTSSPEKKQKLQKAEQILNSINKILETMKTKLTTEKLIITKQIAS